MQKVSKVGQPGSIARSCCGRAFSDDGGDALVGGHYEKARGGALVAGRIPCKPRLRRELIPATVPHAGRGELQENGTTPKALAASNVCRHQLVPDETALRIDQVFLCHFLRCLEPGPLPSTGITRLFSRSSLQRSRAPAFEPTYFRLKIERPSPWALNNGGAERVQGGGSGAALCQGRHRGKAVRSPA